MKKIVMLSTVLLASTALSFGQGKMTVDSVFAKYYNATGGENLWKNVKNYTLKRSYNSGSAADYDAEIYVSMPEQAMSKSKIIMKRSFIYGVKGNEGWLKIPIGGSDKTTKYQVKDLSQSEQSAMRLEMYDLLVPFVNYKDRALVATFVGTEKLDGKPVNQVELQGKGVKYNLYFDAATGLLVREKQTLDGVVTTTDYSEYKKSAYGLMYPATLVETSSKDNSKTTISSELAVNETISPEYFQR
ncbi:hypothetical protein [Salmonirosea aquatica]|uniref:Outer membrane lipoprotein-sorting protein n=1 Tax=Salmonirosea aquatica TaxID=2654236 RepID=A0A7C9BG19_9BACT|nr:hypothetical protein [Cytophagaceae bacterium SJW1-29]